MHKKFNKNFYAFLIQGIGAVLIVIADVIPAMGAAIAVSLSNALINLLMLRSVKERL